MRIRYVRQAALTTTGTLDFTVSGAGTCIGVVFWLVRATADATPANSASISIGAFDGTRQWAMGVTSEHAVANTNTTRRGMTDQAIMLLTVAGAINGEAAGSAFITDGARISFGDAFTAATVIAAALVFSDNANDRFYVGTVDNTSGDADVTAPGFRPSAVMLASINRALDDAAGDEAHFSYGWAIDGAVSPPNQFGMTFFEADNQAAGRPATYIVHPTTKNAIRALTDYATLGGGVQVDDFDVNGFTAKQVGAAGLVCGYVAIACDNDLALTLYSTPTSTGATSHTGAGFHPQAVIGFETLCGSLNTIVDSGLGGSVGLFGFAGDSEEFCAGMQVEHSSGTTDTQNYIDDQAIALPAHDGGTTDDILGEVTAILSNGFEITYSAVASSVRFFGGLAIQLRLTATGVGVGPLPQGSGSVSQEFTASGTGIGPDPQATGSVSLEFTASGTGVGPVPQASGSAALKFTASGVGQGLAPVGSGSVAQEFTSSGTGVGPLPQGQGQVVQEFAASGAGVGPLPVGSGQVLAEFTAAALGVGPLPAGSGVVAIEFQASGVGVAPAPVGSGSVVHTLAAFTASGLGVGPLPVGSGSVLLEFVASALGVGPLPVGSGAVTSDFDLPPMACPTQLLGSYVVASQLAGSYLARVALLGSYDVVTELEGDLC